MVKECYTCRRVGTVQFLSQDKVWTVRVVFDGYEEQSTTRHEHNHPQTGNVSAAIIVIAEHAQARGDQPAFVSNENNETHFISLLTTHEVSRGDADALIVCSALEFAQNGQTVTVVAEDTGVLILLVYHWRTTYSSERKADSQARNHLLSRSFMHEVPGTQLLRPTVMEICTGCISIVSDRDAPADEVGSAGLRLYCPFFLVEVELKRIHYHHCVVQCINGNDGKIK